MSHKAVLIGVNYIESAEKRIKLSGCINDTSNILAHLKTLFTTVHVVNLNSLTTQPEDAEAAPDPNTLLVYRLTDDQEGKHYPSVANILASFQWLTEGAKAGDARLLCYSGHGSQTRDLSNDELDGKDETICPADFRSAGMISDDCIRATLVDPLPEGVCLHCHWDCCHSGSMGDLRYGYLDGSDFKSGIVSSLLGTTTFDNEKVTETRCDVVMISGCRDTQTSADAYVAGTWSGALTTALLDTLRKYPAGISYRKLHAKLSKLLSQRGYAQKVQLTSGRTIDLDSAFRLF